LADRPSLDDYVDVAERIQTFKQQHPDGSLQTVGWEIKSVDDKTFVVYHAAAFRTPDDQRPGLGIAWEPFPGKTPYTRDSELMNAETAAWGRAIVAVGLASSRKIASRQEVQARMGEEGEGHKDDQRPAATRIPVDRAQAIAQRAVDVNLATWGEEDGGVQVLSLHPVFQAALAQQGVDKIGLLNVDQAEGIERFLEEEAKSE
jgi:hypothetical protein